MKRFLTFIMILLFANLFSQQISVMQEQLKYYDSLNISAKDYYKINKPAKINSEKNTNACNLNKIVYGWHPYWVNGLEVNYDWNLLSDFCYFSYEVDASTGNAITTHSWETTSSVTEAINNGVNTHLCVTLFSDHATLLGSTTSKQTLINNLITLISNRGAKGVNIDFEGVSSTLTNELTAFMIDLSNQMHAAIPGSVVSIDLFAVDWNSVVDVAAMSPYVDLFIVMGYDYYWSGSSEAGPNSPLYTFNTSYNYNLTKTITYYLDAGIPNDKLVMGIPYYGRDYPTSSSSIPSATTGSGSTRTYKTVMDNTSGYYSTRLWEPNSFNSYYVYNNGSWHQCFTDDEFTLSKKYEIFNRRNIAGIGIWTLGYDDGYTALWNTIRDYFTDCATTVCTDTIYDMGGPTRNYYDNEDYTYTIAPTGATNLSLNFTEFNIEDSFDSLWIYDGNSVTAPLIGEYTGITGPGLVISTGNALTLRFKSDGLTTESGFKAIWQCNIDVSPPSTSINTNEWETTDFIQNFTDYDDNIISLRFYQVLQNDGIRWTANSNNGFFYDDFSDTINWESITGTWDINAGVFNQSDEINSNTNTYAVLNQDGTTYSYLYHWKMKISGSGTNRRAGIYFFSDDATQDQRNNAYMIYFRVDQNKCQIYKAVNNSIYIKTDDDCVVDLDSMYDYKVIYNTQTGRISAYQNNILVSEWIDSTPLQNGGFISLRTGECNVFYDDFYVYKSRNVNTLVTVGSNTTNDVFNQNVSPTSPSCRIKSIVIDDAGNFSDIADSTINIDWTNPVENSFVNDGLTIDEDTTYDYIIDGNWDLSSDENSGIKQYWYSIGTSVGANNILDWTNANTNINFTNSALALFPNTNYFINVKTENNAGLFSSEVSSDGILLLDTNLAIFNYGVNNNIKIYPNPAKTIVYIALQDYTPQQTLEIYNTTGILIKSIVVKSNITAINISNLKQGVYVIRSNNDKYLLLKE